jgi:subtilisin family serine protease
MVDWSTVAASRQDENNTTPMGLIGLPPLMDISSGGSNITVALIDGPVALHHPDLANASIRLYPGHRAAACERPDSAACSHGTLVAGVLHAKRDSALPGVCPSCTLLVRPIFSEAATIAELDGRPNATMQTVATAILEVIEAGARIINLSVGVAEPNSRVQHVVEEALDRAACHNVIVVAASGNQGVLGSSAITRHPWVIPVVACGRGGQVLGLSNLGGSIGRRGVAAPGHDIESLAAGGGYTKFTGTSAAVPFVTGTIALLWSAFPQASATAVRLAVTTKIARQRRSVTPPLLDAWAAYQALGIMYRAGHQ